MNVRPSVISMCLCVILNKKDNKCRKYGASSTAPISQHSFVDVFCNKFLSNSDDNLERRVEIYFKPSCCSCFQKSRKLLCDISCKFPIWNVIKVGQ